MVDGFSDLFLGELAGALDDAAGSWTLLLVPAAGAILVAILVEGFAREAKGHGVPEVMRAVATQGGRIRPRVAAVKALASAITIGAGGSAGREGPIVQVGAALASTLGRIARQPPEMVTLMVAGGGAGGISATFNAPIAGVFFALEVILRRFNVRNFTLVVVSAVVANMIAIGIEGDNPGIVIPQYRLESALEIGLYALVGLAAAVVGVIFARVLYLLEDGFEALPVSPYVKPVLGMLVVGALGVADRDVLGTGFTGIEDATQGLISSDTLLMLLSLKILAASFTLGSGASDGVFAPSLFLGAMLGGLMGSGFVGLWPDSVAPEGAYAVVGMAAVFAAAARAPITALFIVFELTRDYSLILPLMTGVVIATTLAQFLMRDTIYTAKLKRSGLDLPEEDTRVLMDQIAVAEAMTTNITLIQPDAALVDLTQAMNRAPENVLAVSDDTGRYRGMITAADLTAALERTDAQIVAKDLAVQALRVHPDDTLRHVVAIMAENDLRQVPVVARWDESRLLGMISQRDVLRSFARRGAQQPLTAQPTAPVTRLVGAVQIEATVLPASSLVGCKLREVALPSSAVITTIHRMGSIVIPRGAAQLEAGDLLTILAEPAEEAAVRSLLRAAGAEVRARRASWDAAAQPPTRPSE